MNSSVGQLGSPIFRPLGGLCGSLVFHGILAMLFIGWFTSNLPKTGVLPPAISLQLGLYQLEQQQEPEVNNAPKQQMATREEIEPEVVEKAEKLPQTPLVDNGTLTRVTEKKRPPKKKPVQEKKVVEEAPVSTQESEVTSVPTSGSASNSSANFASSAAAPVSGHHGWESDIHQRLAKAKRYPRAALRFRSTGASQVKIIVDNQGQLVSASLINSSGTKLLDKEALATIERAAPFPMPHETLLANGKVELIAPIVFDTTSI